MSNTTQHHTQHRSWFVFQGLAYGALAGLVASEVFIAGLCLLVIVGMAVQQASLANIFSTFGFAMLGQLYGTLPAIAVGGICGAVIGLVFAVIDHPQERADGIVIGICVSAVLLIVIVAILVARNTNASYYVVSSPQPVNELVPAMLFLLPIVALYLGSGSWVGHKLAQTQQSTRLATPTE